MASTDTEPPGQATSPRTCRHNSCLVSTPGTAARTGHQRGLRSASYAPCWKDSSGSSHSSGATDGAEEHAGCYLPRVRRATAAAFPTRRPARYHGSACRQRARRARLRAQTEGQDWAALDEVDTAITDVRRLMATGRDPRPALARLLTAALGIADLHGVFLSIERPGCSTVDRF